jgi:hypothetical protein
MLDGAKRPPAHRSYGSERNPDLSGMLDLSIADFGLKNGEYLKADCGMAIEE